MKFDIFKQIIFWVGLVIIVIPTSPARAKIPSQIHFQGMLTDKDGQLIQQGQHALQFSIWNQQSPSDKSKALWQERHLVTVKNGVYSVLLGSHTLFSDPDKNPSTDDALSFAVPYYLDIQYKERSLASKGKLFPLTTVWTAFRANSAEGRLVTSVNNNHIIQAEDDIIFAKGGIQVTLPRASTNRGRIITIKKSDAQNKSVSIHCQANNHIIAPQTANAEQCPVTLTQAYEELTLISDGQLWWGMGQVFIHSDQLDLTDAVKSTDIKNGSITHLDISPDASIAYEQLSLLNSIQGQDIVPGTIKGFHIQAKSIANIHIAATASIAYTKLNLTGQIDIKDFKPECVETTTIKDATIIDQDIAEDAQIQYKKLNLVRAIQHRDLQASTVDSEIIKNKTIRDIDIADNARIQYKKLKLTDSIHTIDIRDQSITPSKLNHIHTMGKKHQALTADGQGGFEWKHMNVLDHVYVVGAGSVYETINDALSDARTIYAPVLIKVGPGVYNEQVVTRSNTCIEGAGQGITIIRYHGGKQGTAASATVVGYTDVELRDLTIISDASITRLPNAIGLYNMSSVSLRHVSIKAFGGTAYNYGIYNDRCQPNIHQVEVQVRSTVTEESWNYGIYNEFSDAHIEYVEIQAWGGDRTFGIANKSSFPEILHTHVTTSAGVMKNRGIWNESSSPRISFSEVIVSGVCHDNYGIENYNNSSPIIKNSMIKAVGLTSYGLYQWGSSQDAIRIYYSNIAGETNSIFGGNAQFLVAHSQIDGSISADIRCVASFNRKFMVLDEGCQLKE
ncbi:MAG: hypothetical protein OMM_08495 [Candidatus Magnetoglobus multicellularis str. Araruama]|uniref:Pectinesterase catalytic domain-containing protein n=1 Tax=Candidatus Magnetoglobus multicellularis str. Araruama TaxID=890399 RepID=A0A1V1P7K4_9BACT|nr:MAG: hypothetical protein OMM_08495 [Candidatus Magnetoglobus multicellularis str. Araruama]